MIDVKQPIVHKLLIGAGSEVWLPFARSKLADMARRFGKSRFFSEKYWVGDFSVEVKQAPPFQYINIVPAAPYGVPPGGGGGTPISDIVGTDRWYDVATLAVIPWQAYSAQTAANTPNYQNGYVFGIYSIDDDNDTEGDIVDLPTEGERSAWWQITADANGTLDADVLQNVGSPAGTLLDVVTTDVVSPILEGNPGSNCDFSDCYVVAHGTDTVTGVTLTSGKVYWIRVAITDTSDVTYRLRITVTL